MSSGAVLVAAVDLFGDEDTHWECREGILCEHHLVIARDHRFALEGKDLLKPTYSELLLLSQRSNDSKAAAKVHQLWWIILEGYMVNHLSFWKDRLLAVVGVASVLQKDFRMRAVYGMFIYGFWMDSLVHNLL